MAHRPADGRPPSLGRGVFRVLWQQPLWAIPFAIFFGTMFGGGSWIGYQRAYWISLLFAYVIGFSILGAGVWLGHQRKARERRFPLWAEITTYASAAFVASLVAALIAHLTISPGMLGSPRGVAITAMFALIFTLLITGIAYAYNFYGQAIARVRSEQELNMARRIQRGFLLSQFPTMPRLEVHALNVSSREVSGDFYDVVPAGDGAFLLAIADVSGKGVPAALLSSMLQASLRTQAATVVSVGEILRNVNRLVQGTASPGQFATFFLARVDEARLRLSFTNAGHNYPMLFRRDGRRIDLQRGGTVVGILPDARFEEETIELETGDRLILYTDGISEAANPAGEFYGEERLVAVIESLPSDLPAREIVESILAALRVWLDGREPGDDMTLMVLRVLD